jgi:hypothetical protein
MKLNLLQKYFVFASVLENQKQWLEKSYVELTKNYYDIYSIY